MDLHTGRSLSFQYLKVMATSFLLCGSAGGGKHYVGWGKKQPLLWYKTYRHALLIQHSHSQAVGAKCRASFQRKPGAIRPAVPTVAWRRVGRLLARAVFFTNKTSSLQLNSCFVLFHRNIFISKGTELLRARCGWKACHLSGSCTGRHIKSAWSTDIGME